ncbi:hypothetical protein HO173_003117 [Letharia columbiana]|uniref:Uncharacterized protein n=1 Tax=Letharia columbiana TaxID=112416 RepID=A0A8H6G174_9LECA|nr:uncharacterized protein HO173_003117 [Letharia columbiana]KAF6238611.1 hypothetical protein HO173_003117 [Letharia columbiana]
MATLSIDLTHYCRPCLRRLISQTRSFTTTPTRRVKGPLPVFHPTPSPDLDALLNTFRTNIFFPSHLLVLQQDLVYKKSNHALLTSDEPATVRLGDEVLQLLPLDKRRDEPPTRSSFAKVVQLMEETGDWGNMAAFLEGLKVARRKLAGWQVEKMVRRANEVGNQGVVMDILNKVKKTGVGLWDVKVCREVMRGAVLKATQSGWSDEGVERGLKYAEKIWDLMWDPRHVEEQKKVGTDLRGRPEIVGVVVLMHAVKAVKLGGGKDEGGIVAKYAEVMLERWENSRGEMVIDAQDWSDANYKLMMWAPVWHGMKMARQVVGAGSPLGGRLDEKLSQDLEPLIHKSRAITLAHTPADGMRRGLKVYEDMLQASS